MFLGNSLAITRISNFGGETPVPVEVPLYQRLASRSQEPDNAAWTKSNVTAAVSAIESVYGDGTFAIKMANSGAGSAARYLNHATTAAVTNAQTYAFFADAEAAEHGYMQLALPSLQFGANAWATFNLVTGAATNVGSAATAEVVALGGGRYRCAIKAPATTTGAAVPGVVALTDNANAATRLPAYTPAVAGGIYLHGLMFHDGATLRPYQRVVASSADATQPAIAGVQDAATVVP